MEEEEDDDNNDDDDDDLARFRHQWLWDIQQQQHRQQHQHRRAHGRQRNLIDDSTEEEEEEDIEGEEGVKEEERMDNDDNNSNDNNVVVYAEDPFFFRPSVHAAESAIAAAAAEGEGGDGGEAEKVYVEGIMLEREGRLGEAIAVYRRALKMDPDVESKIGFSSGGILSSAMKNLSISGGGGASSSNSSENKEAREERTIEALLNDLRSCPLTVEPYYAIVTLPGARRRAHISDLPPEIMSAIFLNVVKGDMASLSPIARVCRRWFVCTQEPSFWRSICTDYWPSPSALSALAYFDESWLRMYQKRPRIRFDGAYISKVNYFRSGQSEGSWFSPILTVTYYRYLRFFPNGTVVSLLSNDPPALVVGTLTPTSAKCYIGQYNAKEHLESDHPNISIKLWVEPRNNAKCRYKMDLELRSTYPGGSNKISWVRYHSCEIRRLGTDDRDTGRRDRDREVTEYSLDQLRSYYFARVRHYNNQTISQQLEQGVSSFH